MNHIGDPDYQTDHWELQQLPDNCAVVAQTGILTQFGIDITQADATYIALENGWYEPGFGTSADDLGKILEASGVSVHHVDNASIFDLATELQEGHRVLVGVNSSELWQQGPEADFWNWVIEKFGFDKPQFDPADHAICVTGIDTSDPKNPEVIINDPGHPDGAGARYPLDRFVDAWENSGFHYVATDHSPAGATIPTFDIGDFLGIGTTLAVAALTGDVIAASQAGEFVDQLCNEVNWDRIIVNV
jgi:hypothetical protein